MQTPDDCHHHAVPDEQDCPTCGTGHVEPPNSYDWMWYVCEVCEKAGCDNCFASARCCEECFKEED